MEHKKSDNIELDDSFKTRKNSVEESSEPIKEAVDYDELLSAAGGFGRYQLILFISTFPFYIFGGFAYFSQLFITPVSPNHWCWIPELKNLSDLERRNLAIPLDDHEKLGYSRCYAYQTNWTEVILKGDLSPNLTWDRVPCQHGWEFNKTEIPYATISSDLGWVCDKDSYPATAQSIFFLGSVLGGILVGWIADRFGRLPALVISNLLGCIGGVASTFAGNFLQFTICRFIFGMSNDNLTIMAYLIVLEHVAPKFRAFVANLPFALFYAPILVALPWIALVCGHWKIISLVTSVPIALALLSPFFIPESPRWLLSKGKVDKVVERILIIAKANKKEVPAGRIGQFKTSVKTSKDGENVNMLDLLKRPLLRRAYVSMCLVYMSGVFIFDELVRTIEHVKYDFFISFSLISLTELPSLIISAFVLDLLGRRGMIAITMSICCIFSILTAFVGGGVPSLICAIIARFVVNMGFGTVTQWAAEVLPTPVRGTGTSIIHILGYVVIILSPYIAYLEKFIHWFPMVFVACISVFCALLAQTLPETAGKELPQNFDDSEYMIMSQKIFSIPCIVPKTKELEGRDNKGYS